MFSFSIGMGGLSPESVAVLTTSPGQRVEEFYRDGWLDQDAPDTAVLHLAALLGHKADGHYARSLAESHRVRRFEFLTGLPF